MPKDPEGKKIMDWLLFAASHFCFCCQDNGLAFAHSHFCFVMLKLDLFGIIVKILLILGAWWAHGE